MFVLSFRNTDKFFYLFVTMKNERGGKMKIFGKSNDIDLEKKIS